MKTEEFLNSVKQDDYVPYLVGGKKALVGKTFSIVSYALIKDKVQYSGAKEDTYEVVVKTDEGVFKFDASKQVSPKTGMPSRMFQMFEHADGESIDGELTMVANNYAPGKVRYELKAVE